MPRPPWGASQSVVMKGSRRNTPYHSLVPWNTLARWSGSRVRKPSFTCTNKSFPLKQQIAFVLTLSKSLFLFLCWLFFFLLEDTNYFKGKKKMFFLHTLSLHLIACVENLKGSKEKISTKEPTDPCTCFCNALLEQRNEVSFCLWYRKQKRKVITFLQLF